MTALIKVGQPWLAQFHMTLVVVLRLHLVVVLSLHFPMTAELTRGMSHWCGLQHFEVTLHGNFHVAWRKFKEIFEYSKMEKSSNKNNSKNTIKIF